MDIVLVTLWSGIGIILLTIMPGVDILPLSPDFIEFLTTTFTYVKMIREWPIFRVLFEGVNIYLWFLVIKFSWNLLIFILGSLSHSEFIKKLSI